MNQLSGIWAALINIDWFKLGQSTTKKQNVRKLFLLQASRLKTKIHAIHMYRAIIS